MRWFVLLVGVLGLGLASCSGDSGPVVLDAGRDGSVRTDAGPSDAALPEAGPPDGATSDAPEPVDAGEQLDDAGTDGGSDAGSDGGTDAGTDGGGGGDAGSGCSDCHGDATSPAPPASVGGSTATTTRGVGAHRSHLGTSMWHREIVCEDCHVVPTSLRSPGHIDSRLPAELTWSALATADSATPSFDGTSCNGAYCHGATLVAGGSETTPTWTTVDGSQAACGTCHGLAPPAPHPVVSRTDCSGCHPFAGLVPLDSATHINGTLEVTATCGACHALPPATGAHRRHFGVTGTPPSVVYGDLRAVADYAPGGSPEYMFGCGNCHPTDEARHRNGTVDVVLFEAAAPATSLKAKNAPTAAYTAGRCNGIYCHSTGQQTPAFVASPPWTGSFTGLRCASCHSNPPAYPSGGAGTATANGHVVLADDGWELGHFDALPGPWHGGDHGPAVAAPMTCQACHYATVDPANVGPGGFYYLDTDGVYDLGGSLGYRCSTCHTGAVGAPAIRHGAVLTARHVDGRRDVVFDPRTSIPASVTGLPVGANRPTYPYWVTAAPAPRPPSSVQNGTTWSLNLASSGYDPATKTCTAVPCHLNQSFGTGRPMYDPLRWGVVPVGMATCNACHQY